MAFAPCAILIAWVPPTCSLSGRVDRLVGAATPHVRFWAEGFCVDRAGHEPEDVQAMTDAATSTSEVPAAMDDGGDFDPRAIEARWQRVWEDEHTWEVSNDAPAERSAYVLEMLPYTSGEPHVGHLKNYAVGDAVAHFWRRQGYYVLHPMGFDAFGLPAENHAIRTGKHPRISTDESIASFREQFKR